MKDPRTPVSVEMVGKFKVTIFDLEAYNRSLEGDASNVRAKREESGIKKFALKSSENGANFYKQKPAARWNWTKKLETPLGGKV